LIGCGWWAWSDKVRLVLRYRMDNSGVCNEIFSRLH
jgi:hypothetical protein